MQPTCKIRIGTNGTEVAHVVKPQIRYSMINPAITCRARKWVADRARQFPSDDRIVLRRGWINRAMTGVRDQRALTTSAVWRRYGYQRRIGGDDGLSRNGGVNTDGAPLHRYWRMDGSRTSAAYGVAGTNVAGLMRGGAGRPSTNQRSAGGLFAAVETGNHETAGMASFRQRCRRRECVQI